MGCLAALLGSLVGGVVGVLLTFPLMSGIDADAFSWLAMFLVFGFIGALLGAGAGLGIGQVLTRRRAKA